MLSIDVLPYLLLWYSNNEEEDTILPYKWNELLYYDQRLVYTAISAGWMLRYP